jgi:hypothetical protein
VSATNLVHAATGGAVSKAQASRHHLTTKRPRRANGGAFHFRRTAARSTRQKVLTCLILIA